MANIAKNDSLRQKGKIPNIKLRLARYSPLLILVFSISIQVALQLPTITFPAVNSDEVMWINVAKDTGDQAYIRASLFDKYPVMLMDYIGAIKGYLMKPIFAIFGSNVFSLRLPMVILAGAGSGLLGAVLFRKGFKGLSVVLVIFLSISSTLGIQSQFDLGPSILEYTIRCILISLGIVAIGNKDKWKWILLLALSLAGIWNKFSFVWFLNGLVITTIVNLKLRSEKTSKKEVLTSVVPYLIGIALFLLMFRTFSDGQNSNDYFFNAAKKLNFIFESFSISPLYNEYWQSIQSYENLTVSICGSIGVLAALVRTGIVIYLKAGRSREIQALEILISSISILNLLDIFQIMFTPEADRPWHAFCAWPALPLMSLLGWQVILSWLYNLPRPIIHRAVAAFLISILAIQTVSVRTKIYESIASPQGSTSSWSRIINTNDSEKLYKYLHSQKRDIVFADWGFHTTSLFYFSDLSGRILDLTDDLQNERVDDKRLKNLFDEGAVFVTHGEKATAWTNARQTLFEKLNSLGRVCQGKSISDSSGIAIYEIWQRCS